MPRRGARDREDRWDPGDRAGAWPEMLLLWTIERMQTIWRGRAADLCFML